MEVNYQKTMQLNTDITSFNHHIGVLSLLVIPSKRLVNYGVVILSKFIKKLLFRELNKLSKLYYENRDIFPNEYYDCLEINDMIEYTLNRDLSLIKPEDLRFVNHMSNSFFELTSSKLELLKDNNYVIDEKFYDSFNPKYDQFNRDLIKSKEYFYRNIYNESFDEQEIADYINVAWE